MDLPSMILAEYNETLLVFEFWDEFLKFVSD
jgi:hypothetical protein